MKLFRYAPMMSLNFGAVELTCVLIIHVVILTSSPYTCCYTSPLDLIHVDILDLQSLYMLLYLTSCLEQFLCARLSLAYL